MKPLNKKRLAAIKEIYAFFLKDLFNKKKVPKKPIKEKKKNINFKDTNGEKNKKISCWKE